MLPAPRRGLWGIRVTDHRAPYRTGTVWLSFLAFILIGASDGAIGVVLPSIQQHYRIDKAIVGLLFLFSTFGYIAAAFGSGPFLERLGRRWLLVLGTGLLVVGAGLIGFAPPFAVLLGALTVYGFAFGIIDAGINAYVTTLPESTGPLNFLHACYSGGAFLGPPIAAGILLLGGPWNRVYLLWAVLGCIMLLAIARIFPAQSQPLPASGTRQESLLGGTLRLRIVWFSALFMLCYVGTEVSVGSWSFSYLTEVRGRASLLASWSVSGFWLGLTAGRAALAYLAPRIGISNRRLVEGSLIAILAGLALVWLAPAIATSALGLFIAGVGCGPIYPVIVALMPELLPARIVPSAVGFLASFGGIGGALFPWLAGNIAQVAGLGTFLPYAIGLALLTCVWWLLLRARAPDARRAGI
jgi:fucose permease